MKNNTAYVFCIGRELLEGLVLDRNANFMAGKLTEAGWRVQSIQVLDDDEGTMVDAFKRALAHKPRYIFTTGGMGPGHDDITRQGVAKAAGLELHTNEAAVQMIAKSYRRLFAKGVVENPAVNDDRIKMAQVPRGSICYENPIGAAPAVRLQVGETLFFLMPGVPEEMQQMFNLYAVPVLREEGPPTVKRMRQIEYPGQDESVLSRVLADLSRRYPGVLSRAKLITGADGGKIEITISAEHTDEAELEALLERAEDDMRARLGLEVRAGGAPGGAPPRSSSVE